MRSERYQLALIFLGIVATIFLGVFLYREIFPEYRIYQDDYVALEDFRSTYTGEPPPAFQKGVKQIVFEREDKGPANVDRCVSCHVAEQLPHFSPTKISHDINGNIVRNADGIPVQVPNEDYIWSKLNQKIADLRDPKVNEQLEKEGGRSKIKERQKEAEKLESLKVATVGEHTYDVTKVLRMHPLIGKEVRPFEYHSLDEYGCTSCHSGNGKGLTTEKAHGPVFDGEYETENLGYVPEFTERDSKNDPQFSRVFNAKPGDALIFQTTPILVGHLIQASCIQCHEQSSTALQGLAESADILASRRKKNANDIDRGYRNEKEALLSLIKLKQQIDSKGYEDTLSGLEKELNNPSLLTREHDSLSSQLAFLAKTKSSDPAESRKKALSEIDERILTKIGSPKLVKEFESFLADKKNQPDAIDQFLNDHANSPEAAGSLFKKWEVVNLQQSLLTHVEETQKSFKQAAGDENVVSAMASEIDWLTKNYHRGAQLYISQACYACHKIAGMARGGVGPELTHEGESYPWFVKQSIVWPQADVAISTMPNYVLDHVELEDLMTFMLGQKGPTKAVSQTDYKTVVQEWEAGRKMSWEKPIPPSDIRNLRYSMTVFATEGCAACHRLHGFESNVGFAIEAQGKPSFDELYREHQWFQALIPEESLGSSLVKIIEKNADEIDKRIVDHVREDSIIEELEERYPETVEALYANFRFASRAKNAHYQQIADQTSDPALKKAALDQLEGWKKRVHRLLMMYVQEYGLGRLIGPRPNWSGVYRSDEWLMEHFHNPAGHVPRSIMPVLPFDDSKFHALVYMLDVLGKRNRDALKEIWNHKGFDPKEAFHLYCAQCHGDFLQGNGPVSVWIYPIPKNLRNAEFLRNLTKQNATQSIMHGVKGTPMPPWGETPKDKETYDDIPVLTKEQIAMLVDWLYSSIPGATVIRSSEDVPKWHYTPNDVIDELKREGSELKSGEFKETKESSTNSSKSPSTLGTDEHSLAPELKALIIGNEYYAALEPKVFVSPKEELNDIFDVIPNPIQGGEKYNYYIKKKYYTEDNIERGRQFFELNCAVCHGADADGSGIRASVMIEAKPRMLINLDWINTRDDLRLLRSIKYGVPGTAMTPWGDFTSSLQRLQLVMFIRSLSFDKEKRESLAHDLYTTFDEAEIQVENARIAAYPAFDKLQIEYDELQKKRRAAGSVEASLELYKQQLELSEQLKQQQALDQIILDMKNLVGKENEIYFGIGNDLMAANVEEEQWKTFLRMIPLNGGRFAFKEGHLLLIEDPKKNEDIQTLANQIAHEFVARLASLEQERKEILSRPDSSEKDSQMRVNNAEMATYSKLKTRLLSGIKEIGQIRDQEKQSYERYQQLMKNLETRNSQIQENHKTDKVNT